MDWEAIGAIGEVVGAFGVIATLGYLAAQIRQNTDSVRASTTQEMSEAAASFLDLVASDENLPRIFFKGMADLSSLNAEERLRFHFLFFSFLRRTENFHRQAQKNRVEDDDWTGLRESCVSLMSLPGSREWWNENTARFNPDFVEWLERRIDGGAD